MQLEDIRAAADRLAGRVVYTPCTRSVTLSAMTGADLHLKLENQQFTGSFKERGALNCLLQLTEAQKRNGVIAMSAGNHAQALAYHGERLGIPTTIVMPRSTPNTKVEHTRVFGAEVILHGSHFDETKEFTERLVDERDLTLVHPFDDPRVIAGQGTIGLEVLEQVPDVECIVVPVGGGGLISGVAVAVKALCPQAAVIGIQVDRYAAVHGEFHKTSGSFAGLGTVAEGIAVKSPGALTLALIDEHVDDMLLVTEAQIEQSIFTLLEIEKTLVEGAGAASLAAVQAFPDRFIGKKVVSILTGGNIDMMILSSVLQRGMVRTGRLVRLKVEIPDVPGALAKLTQVLGDLGTNIVDIVHQRAFAGSSVRATQVELVLQMRGDQQVDQLISELQARDYEVSRHG
jgi:threonine dehydratase